MSTRTMAKAHVADRALSDPRTGEVWLRADDRHVYTARDDEIVATFLSGRVWRGDRVDGVPFADVQDRGVYPHGGFATDPVAITDDPDPAHAALWAVFALLYDNAPDDLR